MQKPTEIELVTVLRAQLAHERDVNETLRVLRRIDKGLIQTQFAELDRHRSRSDAFIIRPGVCPSALMDLVTNV